MSKLSIKEFEQSISSLEEIVKQMDEKELSLDKALNNFKNGIKLVQKCEKAIHEAKQTVNNLLESAKTSDTPDKDNG